MTPPQVLGRGCVILSPPLCEVLRGAIRPLTPHRLEGWTGRAARVGITLKDIHTNQERTDEGDG